MTSLQSNTNKRPWRVQISLGFMMLLMVVFSFISAALLYASKVPVVQQEWSTLIGREPAPDQNLVEGQSWHLIFILFTFTSPLMLAGVLSTLLSLMRWSRKSRRTVQRQYVQ